MVRERPSVLLSTAPDPAVIGVVYALGAFLVWGLAPIYFKSIDSVPPLEIVAHRVVWSVVVVGAVTLLLRRPAEIAAAAADPRRLALFLATTSLISVNWLLYIWAVVADHILEASLGYYINPLVNVVLGMAFLGERLNRAQAAAVLIATAGVLSLVFSLGTLPWIALTLAVSFGLYALLRKKANVDPLLGALVETVLLAPFCLGFLVWQGSAGRGSFGVHGLGFDLWLAASGMVTIVPILLFTYGAARLKLSTIGLMQYLAPTLQLVIGVWLYGEAFTPAYAVAFGAIWVALALYSADAVRSRRTARMALAGD